MLQYFKKSKVKGAYYMKYEKISVGVGSATLTVYDSDGLKGDAILVIPGGGYNMVCADREGEPIALSYLSKGIKAFVLNYSVGKDAAGHQPLVEASAAMAYLRTHREALGITGRIYAVGFSAGGHLTASLATMWHRPEVIEKARIAYGDNRPDAVALCYPVISGFEYAHKGSFYNITGTNTPTDEQLYKYSAEKHVDEKACPAFIIHTANDTVVPVENALLMAEAYSKNKIPFELHIYPDAPHGIALANEITSCGNQSWVRPQMARWVDDSIYFFNHLDF